jgi:hypothetical protein
MLKSGIVSVLMAFFAGYAQANMVQAQIIALQCGTVNPKVGATTVSLSGTFAGSTYLNITNINPWGFPFTQQALIKGAHMEGNDLTIELRSMVTGADLELRLENKSKSGYLSMGYGEEIELSCMVNIQRARE